MDTPRLYEAAAGGPKMPHASVSGVANVPAIMSRYFAGASKPCQRKKEFPRTSWHFMSGDATELINFWYDLYGNHAMFSSG
jgi:hypothetical protein